MAWHAKEVVRAIYEITDDELASEFVEQLGQGPPRPHLPARGALAGAHHRALAGADRRLHQALVSNGPTEAVNNLIKRIKRIGFGFRRFAHYRIRVLLYGRFGSKRGAASPSRLAVAMVDEIEVVARAACGSAPTSCGSDQKRRLSGCRDQAAPVYDGCFTVPKVVR